MKRKAKLKMLDYFQTQLKGELMHFQRRQLELLDSITLQLEDSIQEIEITKQKITERV